MALDPAVAAMLAFGGGLASAANPTRIPTGLGGALGGATQGGLAAYIQAQDLSRRDRLADLQQLETALKLRQSQQQRQAVQKYTQRLPENQRPLATAFPEIVARQQARSMFARTKAPTVRDFYEGGQIKQKQWDPSSRRWVQVGHGPRWQSYAGAGAGGLSTPQARFNSETLAARRQLQQLGMSAEEVQTASQEYLPTTGLPNPNYNPMVRSLATKAARRLYGQDDPGYEQVLTGIFGSGQPEMQPPTVEAPAASPTAAAPAAGGEPGWMEQAWAWWTGDEGEQPAPQRRPQPARPITPTPRRARGAGKSDLPDDLADLKPGKTYTLRDGRRARWTGRDFVEVR